MYKPTTMTIEAGEKCPGRFLWSHPEMVGWFEAFEAARAFPGAFVLGEVDARAAEAMIQIEGEVRLIEAADTRTAQNEAHNG